MTREEINALLNVQHTIILNKEAALSSKDYIGTKIAMGVATIDDYKEDIEQTEAWRAEIRAAKEEIKRLEAIEPEEEPISDEEAV